MRCLLRLLKRCLQRVFNGTPVYQTDYVGFNNQLAFVGTDEGRAVKNATGGFDYEYFLKDHQGNTRVVFGLLNETREYKATMEPALAAQEEYNSSTNPDGFRNLPSTRVVMFNHTPKSALLIAPDMSAETNGNNSKAIGPAKMLEVIANDRIQIEVYARYSTGIGSNTALVSGLASLVTGTFGLSSGEAAYNALTNHVPGQAAAIPAASEVAKAYVCYILFDNSYTFRQFGYQRITAAASNGHERLFLDAVMPYAGFVYIYVANESDVSGPTGVYFDDLSIVHEKTGTALQVLQTNDYLPFGLTFNEYYQSRAVAAPSTVYPQNKYQFQDQERQTGFDLGWYHFKYRMHDPAIGRFGMVDPLADKYAYNSTYAFSENVLINSIELEGLESHFSINMGSFENGFKQIGGPLIWDPRDSYNFQLAGINQWVTNGVKNYPMGIFEKMQEFDMVQMMVDGDNNYLGIHGSNFPNFYGDGSRFSFKDGFLYAIGGKLAESWEPGIAKFRKNTDHFEVGFEGHIGMSGLNLSARGGAYSTAVDNAGIFGKLNGEVDVTPLTLRNFFKIDYGLNFYFGFVSKNKSNVTAKYAGRMGPFMGTGDADGNVAIGLGFGKQQWTNSGGLFSSKELFSRMTSTKRVGN